jgi:hypothetical protein
MKGKKMRPFDIRNINRLNSNEWTKCNDDSRSPYWRGWVVDRYGGKFIRGSIGKQHMWIWESPPAEEEVKWIFIDPDGKEHRVNNFVGFCKEHGLDDANMYNTYTGKRKHHKGWKVNRLYGIEGRKNPKDFGRELPPPARS